MAGLTRRCKNLKNTYASKEEAEEAAKAEWLRIQRGEYKFNMTLAIGRPDIMPQSPVVVSGYKKLIDETGWIADKIRHEINNNGYTTSVDLKLQN